MTYGKIYDKLTRAGLNSNGINKSIIVNKCKELVKKNFDPNKGELTVAYKATVMKQLILNFHRKRNRKRKDRKEKINSIWK